MVKPYQKLFQALAAFAIFAGITLVPSVFADDTTPAAGEPVASAIRDLAAEKPIPLESNFASDGTGTFILNRAAPDTSEPAK